MTTTYLNRKASYPIQSFFLSRTSSRAFSEERLSHEELMSLFEAARWAPSCYNHQPWRFSYARRGEPEWDLFFGFLVEFNQSWCCRADTLVVVASRNCFEKNGKPAQTAQFDAGSSWMSLAIEAHLKGWVAHGMQGFDYAAAKEKLQIPDVYTVEAMIAIGKKGDPKILSEDLQKMEMPTERKSLEEIVAKGSFPFK